MTKQTLLHDGDGVPPLIDDPAVRESMDSGQPPLCRGGQGRSAEDVERVGFAMVGATRVLLGVAAGYGIAVFGWHLGHLIVWAVMS